MLHFTIFRVLSTLAKHNFEFPMQGGVRLLVEWLRVDDRVGSIQQTAGAAAVLAAAARSCQHTADAIVAEGNAHHGFY